jgi:DNA-binding transcriptional ArsR family regulator
MSPFIAARSPGRAAPLFAALGDATRLELVARLSREGPQSISALADDVTISRQAVTKHLEVLEEAGLAASRREGRERIFELRPRRLAVAHRYLDQISRQWDAALGRLQAHLEDGKKVGTTREQRAESRKQ